MANQEKKNKLLEIMNWHKQIIKKGKKVFKKEKYVNATFEVKKYIEECIAYKEVLDENNCFLLQDGLKVYKELMNQKEKLQSKNKEYWWIDLADFNEDLYRKAKTELLKISM